MDEHLQQIAEALKAAADCTVTDNDIADAEGIVETVERMLRAKDAQARDLSDTAQARDAYLRDMNTAAADRDAAHSLLDGMRDRYVIACVERDKALAALNESRMDAVHWRDEAATWQARYEGMEAALRVAMDVRK